MLNFGIIDGFSSIIWLMFAYLSRMIAAILIVVLIVRVIIYFSLQNQSDGSLNPQLLKAKVLLRRISPILVIILGIFSCISAFSFYVFTDIYVDLFGRVLPVDLMKIGFIVYSIVILVVGIIYLIVQLSKIKKEERQS